ncbi:LuxR C-terminal-related transcriptional regulator [uncultured Sulfitobacter sp.]|uniref:helix-turn-helix transcriptional regulator n=1 Tax=uncultured Sulfitobacter sp. TaxID=191468 RepID=UPI002631030D|nr:LuxR C-terminal-related transcriptional regulator [uncultured Sulfitobacter sp.]
MYTNMSELSAFVVKLNARAQQSGMTDLVNWAVSNLADVLGYDCAWYGWAHVQQRGTTIHASSVYNLPKHYYDTWTGVAHQDLLVEQFIEDPTCVPTYDRYGNAQTDGMETLSDTFGLRKMATAMCLRRDRTASFYISAYRGGQHTGGWTRGDCEFLQCAVDNISAAARIAAKNDLPASDAQTAAVFLSRHGATIVGLDTMRDRFGHLWTRSDGDRVPKWLADYVDQPGEHILIDQELVATCEPRMSREGLSLQKVSLRPLRKFDLLTGRERDVAHVLASGKSHKETARILGVAPSTIRNQTQSIYGKLGIDNRASLAKHVPV